MSIPTIFTNVNCPGANSGGGMLRFCRSYNPNIPQPHDMCWINDQEDYNEYQMGCVSTMHNKFIDNNNNTVWVELKPGYVGSLDKPVEFPIGSHDNYYFVPAPHYEPPYPVFVGEENCDTIHYFAMCCTARPAWSIIETEPPKGKCVIMDDVARQSFANCCVKSMYGTYVDPINGTTIFPTGDDPATQFPSGSTVTHDTDASSSDPTWTGSDSHPAKPTHTITVTKCLV
ncbi:hypothetical protein GGF43_003764 [Coemansia sp. RSA 2618]|nr:hypothetical protein GGF43_003764 [Coemansia sp. RSA 2618]